MTARFLINIRELTIREEFRRILRPAGYLAAPAYLTDAGRVFAATIRGLRGSLIVDNGRFDDVGRVASRYQQETAELLATITATQPVGGRSPHSGVSPQTRVRVSDLARRVAETAAAAQPGLALEEQLRLNPTGVIGVEDITAATWLRLGLDINLQPNGRTALRRRNAAVARHAARVAAGLDQRMCLCLCESNAGVFNSSSV